MIDIGGDELRRVATEFRRAASHSRQVCEALIVTLLEEIITGAAGTGPVPQLLRQVKILSAGTDSSLLAEWVDHELGGYPDIASLPSYRGPFDVTALGHFLGPWQSELRNASIPPSTFPEELRAGSLFKLWVSNAIAEIEEWSHQETVRTGWPSDAVRFYDAAVQRGKIQRIVHQEMTLVKVDTPISGSIFVGILDAVRTRILDLALELEKVAPTAGQPDMGPGVAETAAQVVNTYNFYGTSSVAINSRDVSQTIHAPEQGDENGLLRFLAAGGVSLELLSALQIALAADREEERANGEPGRWARTRAWFRRASTDAGSNALGNLLSTAAVAFFGS